MSLIDNWARVIPVVTFLLFGESHIIGGIVPNIIAFGLFVATIGYFLFTGPLSGKGKKDG